MSKKDKALLARLNQKIAWRVADVAARLDESIWVVYKWVQHQKIPHYRIPGGGNHDDIRFDPNEIEAWIKKNSRKVVL